MSLYLTAKYCSSVTSCRRTVDRSMRQDFIIRLFWIKRSLHLSCSTVDRPRGRLQAKQRSRCSSCSTARSCNARRLHVNRFSTTQFVAAVVTLNNKTAAIQEDSMLSDFRTTSEFGLRSRCACRAQNQRDCAPT